MLIILSDMHSSSQHMIWREVAIVLMQLRIPSPIHIISTNYEIVIDTFPHQMAKTRLVPSEDVPHGL